MHSIRPWGVGWEYRTQFLSSKHDILVWRCSRQSKLQMRPITATPEQLKESYSWAEVIRDGSWRRRKAGEDFRENGDCLQTAGKGSRHFPSGPPFSETQQDEGPSGEGFRGQDTPWWLEMPLRAQAWPIAVPGSRALPSLCPVYKCCIYWLCFIMQMHHSLFNHSRLLGF